MYMYMYMCLCERKLCTLTTPTSSHLSVDCSDGDAAFNIALKVDSLFRCCKTIKNTRNDKHEVLQQENKKNASYIHMIVQGLA